MRFTLFDLLIAIVLVSIGVFVAQVFLPPGALLLRAVVGLVAGLACYVSVSSVLYRRWRRFPLLLPRCPNCHDRNRNYWVVLQKWPEELIRCAKCEASIELRLDHASRPAATVGPRFRLLWPYSFGGRWERLS